MVSMASHAYLCLVAIALLLSNTSASESAESEEKSSEEESSEVANNTAQDLYVIKSVVYEIGILTDAGNDTDSNETHERVDISIFEPHFNGSVVDLSKIPLPIQTNVSGVSVTGLISSNLGHLVLGPNGTRDSLGGSGAFPTAAFPHKQVQVSRNVSTVSRDEGANILATLPQILGLDKLGTTRSNGDEKNGTKGDGESEKNAS